jgi:hypothetical protein
MQKEIHRRVPATLAAACLLLSAAFAQQKTVVAISPLKTVTAKAGDTVEVPLDITVDPGYHVNSNAPSDQFLIGLRLTWGAGSLENARITFPPSKTEKFGFSETQLSVFSGQFRIVTKFSVANTAPAGLGTVGGKLRYQACNDRMCLPPKTLDFDLPVDITK